ncbi:MAG: SMP-30/gluconolactonase/LRE family protein [Pseudomonadota bacterium]
MQPRVVFESANILGESMLWSPTRKSIYWVEATAPRIHRFEPDSGFHETIDVPCAAPLGMIAQTGSPAILLLAQPDGLCTFNLVSRSLQCIAHPEKSRADIGYNDAKVDRRGRLWAGSFDLAEAEPRGALWMLDGMDAPVLAEAGLAVVNGPAFSPRGDIVYVSDSIARRILSFEVRECAPWLVSRKVFAQMTAEEGMPDGLTVDAEGCLWCAHWDGARVTRFAADGSRLAVIELPVPRVTSVAFGGERLETLYVTTARYGLSESQLAASPAAGHVFAIDAGVCGLVEAPFAPVL